MLNNFLPNNKTTLLFASIASFMFPLTLMMPRLFAITTAVLSVAGLFYFLQKKVRSDFAVLKIFKFILLINSIFLIIFLSEIYIEKNNFTLKNLNATEFYFRFYLLAPLFLIGAYASFSKKSLSNGIVLVLLIMAVYSLYQLIVLKSFRMFGLYKFENLYACVQFVLCLILIKFSKNTNLFFVSLGLIAGIAAILMTGTRGVWILLPLLLVYFLYEALKNKKSFKKNYYLITLTALLLLITSIALLPIIKERLINTNNEIPALKSGKWHESSIGTRLDLWKIGVNLANERPFYSGGWGYFKEQLAVLVKEKKIPAGYEHFQGPHNLYILLIGEHGYLIGILFAFYLFLFPIIMIYNTHKKSFSRKLFFHKIDIFIIYLAVCAMFFMSESILERQSGMQWFAAFWYLLFGLSLRDSNLVIGDLDVE